MLRHARKPLTKCQKATVDKSLVIQSLKDAYLFFDGAEKILDMKKGEGYAAAHPEVVAAYMLTAALNYQAVNGK